MLEINLKKISPPIWERNYDLKNYCRQEGLDPLHILTVLRNEIKERKLMDAWREKINLRVHSFQINKR
jgi:hypothetical protein